MIIDHGALLPLILLLRLVFILLVLHILLITSKTGQRRPAPPGGAAAKCPEALGVEAARRAEEAVDMRVHAADHEPIHDQRPTSRASLEVDLPVSVRSDVRAQEAHVEEAPPSCASGLATSVSATAATARACKRQAVPQGVGEAALLAQHQSLLLQAQAVFLLFGAVPSTGHRGKRCNSARCFLHITAALRRHPAAFPRPLCRER
mmetsp:Transcript_91040/g.195193  ORF Transcript_91040/g.195193 Transcript_91040/m.195193 type:complete len:205 (-) Transcript_91040:8-622(-)